MRLNLPNDAKRHEVAQKLRGLPIDMYDTIAEWEKDGLFIDKNISDEADYSQIHDAVFGCFPADQMHPGDYKELHECLADLIDPTCHVVSTISYDWSDSTEYAHKLSCGHTCYTDCPEPPAYCCKCGCRVVEKEDMAYDPDYEGLFDE